MAEATFIHTADLHLKESSEESFQLLRWLLESCMQREAALLVAGDLFDSVEAAVRLRGTVRALFNEAPDVPKFILPGNRDRDAYGEKIDYGEQVYQLDTPPFTCGYSEDVEIVGFPFVPGSSLRDQLDDYSVPAGGEKPVIALVHGTYLSRGDTDFARDVRERDREYFPIFGCDVEDIEACYVALGHYHGRHASFLHKDSVLCYPGTPLALTGAEVGVRTAVAVTVDTGSAEVDIERLPVPVGTYNVSEEIYALPWHEEEALKEMELFLREWADPRAAVTARLKGFIQVPEGDISERLRQLEAREFSQYASLRLLNEATSYRSLVGSIADPAERACGPATPFLVREFVARLAAREGLDKETKARALEMGLRAF